MSLTEYQQRLIHILDETVEYYKTHERAHDGWRCKYKTDDGRMCAVGRCLENVDAIQCEINCGVMPNSLIDAVGKVGIFREGYKAVDFKFWSALQRLHDRLEHWGSNVTEPRGYTLTPSGIEHYEYILKRIKMGAFGKDTAEEPIEDLYFR